MVEGSTDRVSRRPIPGTRLISSTIAFAVEPPSLATPVADQRTVALLQRARSRGVTTFMVAGGRRSRRAERLLSLAFPSEDPELVIAVGRSVAVLAEEGSDSPADTATGDLEDRLRSSLRESGERLAPLKVGLLEWESDRSSNRSGPADSEILERLRAEGAFEGWLLSLPPDASYAAIDRSRVADRPSLLSGAFSVLETGLFASLRESFAQAPIGFFAKDPLGTGRLDGSRFARSLSDRRPDAGPLDVRELQREFDPVLRLGFLTEGRRRTLAQGAIGFVLHWPWVCAAVVPLPAPERLDELLSHEGAPPVSDDEADRVLALPT